MAAESQTGSMLGADFGLIIAIGRHNDADVLSRSVPSRELRVPLKALDGRYTAAMTEIEWTTCTNPQPMLSFLRDKGSDRKLRLFAVACCRRIWDLLPTDARQAALVAEAFADGLLDEDKRSDARKLAQRAAQGHDVTRTPTAPKWKRRAASTAYYATARRAMEAAWNTPQLVVEVLMWKEGGHNACDWRTIKEAEQDGQASLIREVFGNPFRPMTVNPARLIPDIIQLADSMYAEHVFHRMSEVANALERAGCTDAGILAHCRGPGPHVRGCWVVDLLLGNS